MKLQPSIRRGLSGFFVLFSLFLLTACGALHKASSPTVPAAAPVAPADGAPTAVAAPAESAPKALPADASPPARRPRSAPKAFPAESAADPDRRSDEEGLTAMDLMMLAEIAEKLDLDLDGTENLQLLAAIESWMGTPYRYGGCTRFGVDCSCLVKNLYEEVFNLDLARTSRDMFDTLEHVDPEEIREGDILVFRGRRGSRIGHVGLYLKDGKFVHASRRHGVTIGEMKNGYFRKRFVAARRAIPSKAMDLLRMLSRR